MTVKLYADRDAMELDSVGGYYCRHVNAMTIESLHSKGDIAAELGWRDMQIDTLKSELDEARGQVVSLAVENSALKEQTPDVRSACMFEAIEKAEKFMDEGMPELAMVEAFEILKMKRTPATDAVIANIQAQGVEKFGDDLLSDLRGDCWDEHDIKYIEMALNHHLNELRKGAAV